MKQLSVTELLLSRKDEFSKPDHRSDGAHIALVIEAGGMRAASAGGMVEALRAEGWLSLFDSYHGSSAGACAAAYIAAGNPEMGEQIYTQHLLDPRVIKMRRLFGSPSIVDTDYIVDEIFRFKAPLNTGALIDSIIPVYINLTERLSGKRLTINHFTDSKDVYDALRATLRIPGPREKGINIRGVSCVDGGVANPFSIESALDAGATHFFVLCAQRRSDYNFASNLERFWETLFIYLAQGRRLAKAHWLGYRKHLKHIQEEGRYKFVFREDKATRCGIFNQNPTTIRKVWNEGRSAMISYFDSCASKPE